MTTLVADRTAPTDTGRCGTHAGFQRHRIRDEQPCDPCRLTRNAYLRDRRAARALLALDTTGAKPLSPHRRFGRFAGLDVPHRFQPMSRAQCLECWGFPDDPRHL